MDTTSKETENITLKRELGLISVINVIVGHIIGAGIFIAPTAALAYSGSVGMCLTVWASCGIYSLLAALSCAELGALIPESGGPYMFLMEAFGSLHKFWGKLPAFLYSWFTILMLSPAAIAVLLLTFGEYATESILEHFEIIDIDTVYYVKKGVAILGLAVLTFINVISVKLFVKIQNVIGFCKVFLCLIIVFGGIYQLFKGNVETLRTGFENTDLNIEHIILAFYSGLFTYGGWITATVVAGEVKNPERLSKNSLLDEATFFFYRNVPLSMIIALPIITVLYLLVNVAYMTTMSVPEMINSSTVGQLFADRALGPLRFIISVGVPISSFGCALILQFDVSRVCFMAGQYGHVPQCLSYIHVSFLTPILAVLLEAFIALLFIIFGSVLKLVNAIVFVHSIFFALIMICVFILRKTKKDDYRPFKVPLIIPIIVLLVTLFLTIAPIVLNPDPQHLIPFGFLIIAIINYWCVTDRKPLQITDKCSNYLEKLLNIVPPNSEKK